MKPLRFFWLFTLGFAASASVHAKSDWEKFNIAEKNGDWAKAAKLIPLVESSDDAPETLERYANVCEHRGEHAAALRYRERRLWHPKNHPSRITPDWAPRYIPSTDEIYAQHLTQIQAFAAYALRTKQTSEDPCIAAYAKHLAGDTVGAIAEFYALSKTTDWSESVGFSYRAYRELYATHFKNAFEKKDWPTVVALGRAMQFAPPNTYDLPNLLLASENAGDHDAMVRIRYRLLWINPGDLRATVSPRHTDEPNPELFKEVATLAQRHKVSTDVPLLNAWTKHLDGDTVSALADLEKIAASGATREAPVAMFLCGDLWLARKDFRNALSAYYQATYSEFNRHRTRLFERLSADTPDVASPWKLTRFHRTLGSLRQAQVLLLQNKPGLAEYEVQGLFAGSTAYMTGVWNYICAHPDLAGIWGANAKVFTEVLKSKPTGSLADTPFEHPSLEHPFLSGDVVFSANGELALRQSSAAIYQEMAKADKYAFQSSALLATNKKEELARQEAELAEIRRHNAAGPSRFLQSYIAEQERVIVENSPPPSSANSSSAFDFQGKLDGNRNTGSKRRCASCLGSGKAGYVTGSKFQSPTTGQEVAAPACSACGGTGWR